MNGKMKEYFKRFLNSVGSKYVNQVLNGSLEITLNVDELEPYFKEMLLENASYMEDFKEAFDDILYLKNPDKMRSFNVSLEGKSIPLVEIKDINSKMVNHIVKIRQTVFHVSIVRPCYKEAVFECVECGSLSSLIPQTNPFFLSYPSQCKVCGKQSKRNWIIKPELSKLIDRQEFTVKQECYEYDVNVDIINFKPISIHSNDVVEVIGIVSLKPLSKLHGKTVRFAEPYIHALSIKILETAKEKERNS